MFTLLGGLCMGTRIALKLSSSLSLSFTVCVFGLQNISSRTEKKQTPLKLVRSSFGGCLDGEEWGGGWWGLVFVWRKRYGIYSTVQKSVSLCVLRFEGDDNHVILCYRSMFMW